MEFKNKQTTIAGGVTVLAAILNIGYVMLTDGNMTSALEILALATGIGYVGAKATDGSL
jgi:hypothetical protein